MPLIHEVSQVESEGQIKRHHRQFVALREAHTVRDFQLVLSAEVWAPVMEYSVRILEEAVAEEKARNGFGDFLPEPLIVCHPRRGRTLDHGEAICGG